MATATDSVKTTTSVVPWLRSRRAWFAVSLLLVAVGLVLGLFALRQSPTTYPAGSPEHAVATFLDRLQQGNVDGAYALTDFSASGPPGDPRSNFHQQWDGWNTRSHRVTVVRSGRFQGGASVTVDVESFSAGPMEVSSSSTRVTFTLRRAHGAWRITGPAFVYLR